MELLQHTVLRFVGDIPMAQHHQTNLTKVKSGVVVAIVGIMDEWTARGQVRLDFPRQKLEQTSSKV